VIGNAPIPIIDAFPVMMISLHCIIDKNSTITGPSKMNQIMIEDITSNEKDANFILMN
jgi:hypothetical protein